MKSHVEVFAYVNVLAPGFCPVDNFVQLEVSQMLSVCLCKSLACLFCISKRNVYVYIPLRYFTLQNLAGSSPSVKDPAPYRRGRTQMSDS